MTDFVYHTDGILCDDGTIIAIRYIESMRFDISEDQAIVDKLKGDSFVYVTMVSGKEYTVSLQSLTKDHARIYTLEELRSGLLNSWQKYIKG